MQLNETETQVGFALSSSEVAGSNPTLVACNFLQAIGQSTEHSVLITSRKGKPKIE